MRPSITFFDGELRSFGADQVEQLIAGRKTEFGNLDLSERRIAEGTCIELQLAEPFQIADELGRNIALFVVAVFRLLRAINHGMQLDSTISQWDCRG